ncbi:NAD-dependent epimerase/dehydratase family protein [Clostridium sp. Cult3]|uniref:NAD-dependent epimerase/dehydratase family protein n=1 Tax=Clostridium sp. Cult3 TaxID=2079004 RepID=UPI001F4063B4|nr:NAD-dependent epimerase/dehydratase family protein [Clostridium sp. Cult3]MCF6460854.1 UDP-glucose 4-epimerase [Clostridium sp. Cult3]
MNILVTGGAGFIGSNLVDRLIKEGHTVVVVDNLSTGRLDNIHNKAKFYQLDIRSRKVADIFKKEKIEIVYHKAAQIDVQKSIKHPILDGDINILGTINILEACKEVGVKKIIYPSSAAVYGEPMYLGIDEDHPINPVSYYGISKFAPERYIKTYSKLYGIDYTIFRYSNAYGIRQDPKGEGGVIAIFMDKLFRGESPTIFGDGSATRDFIYVEDIVEANIKALHKGNKEVFNIGTGKATSIKELFYLMKEIMDVDIEVKYGEEREGDIKNSFFNINKAKEKLGWIPKYRIEEGLYKTIIYYKELLMEEAMDEIAVARDDR